MARDDWKPGVDRIGAILRARTVGDDDDEQGVELGTFDETTRPSGDQVALLIEGACEDVEALFASGEVPAASYAAAGRLAELRTALAIELSYFPEQAAGGEDSSPYIQLRTDADQAMRRLVDGSQVRDLFGETAAEGWS